MVDIKSRAFCGILLTTVFLSVLPNVFSAPTKLVCKQWPQVNCILVDDPEGGDSFIRQPYNPLVSQQVLIPQREEPTEVTEEKDRNKRQVDLSSVIEFSKYLPPSFTTPFVQGVIDPNSPARKCVNDKGVLVEMGTYGTVGGVAGILGGLPGVIVGTAAGAAAPCIIKTIKEAI